MSTIESLHSKITQKISLVGEILADVSELRKKVDLSTVDASSLQLINRYAENVLLATLEDIDNDYKLSIVDIMSQYYCESLSLAEERSLAKTFYKRIYSTNLQSNIDVILDSAVSMFQTLSNLQKKEENAFLIKKIEKCKSINVDMDIKKTNYEQCRNCDVRMSVLSVTSEMECDACGIRKKLTGMVFEDYQFYNQEGQKTKHGSYDPSRHLNFWLNCILAINVDIDKEDLKTIENSLQSDGIKKYMINPKFMRERLKECKLTKLNDFVPYLVKYFSSKGPPLLNFEERKYIANRFEKMMDYYELVKDSNDRNRPYYPFFIYKIIEDRYSDDPEKIKILEYIHLQSDDTVIKNDETYRRICEKSEGEFKYRSTL